MDPFRRQLSEAERNRIVLEGFATAGARLNNCTSLTTGGTGTQPSLSDEWSHMKSRLTEAALRRNPDLVEAAMDLVFRIERKTNNVCGPPAGTDLALLLNAKLHEGS